MTNSKQRTKDEVRLLAVGYLWDKTQGKASTEAIRSFSDGAAWAVELFFGTDALQTEFVEVNNENVPASIPALSEATTTRSEV